MKALVVGLTGARGTPWARFLCSSRLFLRESRRVKFSAFMPRERVTSVFDVTDLPVQQVQQIGREMVAGTRNLHGHATVTTAHVHECNLEIEADNTPPRHANIVGWPQEKSEQRLCAQELAERASVDLYG